ncbi:MAG: efflux RND transporter periplasmic adaptor subunit [Clostridiales Family XIII bacterium]|jgi:RND family efflux transporter MFP subunit|nr:efflux RND transporter periplasmic adaptor subunit [Clostridiales Family XIII bacterium]
MRKIKWVIGVAVLVVVAGGIFFLTAAAGDKAAPISFVELHPEELANSISVKGRVESVEKTDVYTTLGLVAKEVRVKAGESVEEGQVLCVLDTESLELSIAQQKAELRMSQQSGMSGLSGAQLELDIKKAAAESCKSLYEAGAISKDAYDQAENAYAAAKIRYEEALAGLDSTTDVRSIAIRQLENQVRDAVIKAPVRGTVTAVYAKEGAPGSGLLFVIEDTERLQVSTSIKEYDAVNVELGMDVDIRADSVGDAVYEGRVSKLDPAAAKNAAGETAALSDAEFGAQVEILSPGVDLKIGMEVRMEIMLEKKDGVFGVPYDAVTMDAGGEEAVFAVSDDGQGGYIAKRIPVDTGMETDFYVEIAGSGLYEGIRVISDASDVHDGMAVSIGQEG